MTASEMQNEPRGIWPLTSGSVAVSNETALFVDSLGSGIVPKRPAELAMSLLCLDAFIAAIITSEKVYALTNIRVGIEKQPLVCAHPELPVDIIYPFQVSDPYYPWNDIVRALLSEASFVRLVRSFERDELEILQAIGFPCESIEELVNATARITAGDMWRSACLGIPFLATQFESSACLLDQVRGWVPNFSTMPTNAINHIIRGAWEGMARDANALKGRQFFTVRMPLFLAAVLRESQTIDDLWVVALQIRQSKEAKAFREWLKAIHDETNLRIVAGYVRDVQSLVEDLFRTSTNRELDIVLGISFPPSLSVPIAPLVGMFRREKPHLRFLRRLVGAAFGSARLEQELSRVFGVSERLAQAAIKLM